MAYKIIFEELFADHLDRFSESEQRIILRKIGILKDNPDHPSLRTQRLHRYDNLYESSVSMGIRVIWRLDEDMIILQDVGRHDILKKYG